jgi:hypothetical protein
MRSRRPSVSRTIPLSQQLVRVQAALHNELDATAANQLDRLGRGGVAVRNIDDLFRGDVDTESLGQIAYFPFGADEDWHDHAGGGGIESTHQRGLVTRMGHGSRYRGNAASCRDQLIVFLVSA